MTLNMTNDYPKVAWCTEVSPAGQEYFEELKAAGVEAAIVNVFTSRSINDEHLFEQLQSARKAGMLVHAGMITDLEDPDTDAGEMLLRLRFIDLSKARRVAIMVLPDPALEDQTGRLRHLICRLQQWSGVQNLDICLTREQALNGEIDLEQLPAELNLTVDHVGGMTPGVQQTGTWIYQNKFQGYPQLLAYDFYQYYTAEPFDRGCQLELVGDYEARVGDSWWTIAKQFGLSLLDLLSLNEADLNDRIFPGERIRVN